MSLKEQISLTYQEIIGIPIKFFQELEFTDHNHNRIHAEFMDSAKTIVVIVPISINLKIIIKVGIRSFRINTRFKNHSNNSLSPEQLNEASQTMASIATVIPLYIDYLRENVNKIEELLETREHLHKKHHELCQEGNRLVDRKNRLKNHLYMINEDGTKRPLTDKEKKELEEVKIKIEKINIEIRGKT